jgi:hypothetical protein
LNWNVYAWYGYSGINWLNLNGCKIGVSASIRGWTIWSTSSRLIVGDPLLGPCLMSKYRMLTFCPINADLAIPIPVRRTSSVVLNETNST